MEKIKQAINTTLESDQGKNFLTILIVILVGIGSFYLGRLSKESTSNSLKIEYTGQEANIMSSGVLNPYISPDSSKSSNKTQNSGEYFASNRGSKYYPINCSAGKNIKLENRIYFKTAIEAEKSGYQLSSSCR
jgi:hypothetical protein